MLNRVLNPTFEIKDADTFGKTWGNLERLGSGIEALDGQAWKDTLAIVALGGLTDDASAMLARLSDYERVACESHGVPRKRKARAGVADTPFTVPPLFKSYKSTIKGAIEAGVELLDANGMPLSRDVITKAIAEAKKVDKSDEEKLGPVTDTWLTVFGKCDQDHPLTVDAVNKIINALNERGLLPDTMAKAA
jgi:hypothetical protein